MKKRKIVGVAAAVLFCVAVGLFFLQKQNAPEDSDPEPSSVTAVSSALTWQDQYDLGVRYLSEGNYQEAILAFNAAIEIDPKRPEAYIGRGNARIFSGETEDNLAAALADYEAAIGADSANVEAWLGLADVYIRRGDYEKALDVLREGLEKTGGDQRITDKIANIERGNISDSSGNIRRQTTYDGDGDILYVWAYTYNSLGHRLTSTSFDGSGAQTGHVEHKYDEQGRELQTAYFHTQDGVRIFYPIVYTYDSAGNRVRSDWYMDGILSSYVESEYDSAGNETENRWYESDGTITQRITIEYFADGVRSRETVYMGGAGASNLHSVIEYNADGKEIRTTFYRDGEANNYDETQYDAQGRKTRTDYYQGDGQLRQYTLYEYNEEGRRTKESTYHADGTLKEESIFE